MVLLEILDSIVHGAEEVHVAHPSLLAQTVGGSQQVAVRRAVGSIIPRDGVFASIVGKNQTNYKRYHTRASSLEIHRDIHSALQPNDEVSLGHLKLLPDGPQAIPLAEIFDFDDGGHDEERDET
jgi:hypothetical protein